MKKNLLIIMIPLILCGCSAEYNLRIENDKIVEEMNSAIPKDLYPDYSNIAPEEMISNDDQLTPFIKNDQYAFDNQKYDKEVKEDSENYYVKLSYEYDPDDFSKSKAISGCFENVTYEEEDDYYNIELSGQFYCLYGEELVINITTPNVVDENNANKVSGSKYTWTINHDNVDDTNITIKISKTTKLTKYIMIGLLIAGIAAIIVVGLFVYKKIMDREKTNEI